MTSTATIDCRGQQCPAPILATARAARQLSGGGTIEILADDDAFPLDLKSWCRSSGASLLELTPTSDGHRALVQVLSKTPPARANTPAPSVSAPRASAPRRVDCRGMECPQPILEVARIARRFPGEALEVLADDDAFELDIKSWCRSAKVELTSIAREGSTFTAQIRPKAPSAAKAPVADLALAPRPAPASEAIKLDLRPIALDQRLAYLQQLARTLQASRLEVLTEDRSASALVLQWCNSAGFDVLGLSGSNPVTTEIGLTRNGAPIEIEAAQTAALAAPQKRRATLLVMHNDKEALLAALLVANGAAAQGMEVMLFFTFWGLNLLRGDAPNVAHPAQKVTWSQKLFKWMMPKGPRRQGLGKLNFAGVGAGMMGGLMKKNNIMDLPELISAASEQGIQFVACTMSMGVMGITKRDLHPYENMEYGGVAAFVQSAGEAELSLVF